MEPTFANILWVVIAAIEIPMVVVRMFMTPSPLRLSMALAIPALIILGAAINAIYNWLTTGHMLDAPPRRHARRH